MICKLTQEFLCDIRGPQVPVAPESVLLSISIFEHGSRLDKSSTMPGRHKVLTQVATHSEVRRTVTKRTTDTKAARALAHLKRASRVAIDVGHVAALYGHNLRDWVLQPSQAVLLDLMAMFAAVYFVAREAVRMGMSVDEVDFPVRAGALTAAHFRTFLNTPNPTKKYEGTPASMRLGLDVLQLHNCYIIDDPLFLELLPLYRAIVVHSGLNTMHIFRTMVFAILGRSRDIVRYCMSHLEVCTTPAGLFAFSMEFDGVCGDASAQDTVHFSRAGVQSNALYSAVVLASWGELEAVFCRATQAKTEDQAVSCMEEIPGFKGTGFKAQTAIRILRDLDLARSGDRAEECIFAFSRGRPCLRIGPNPRKFLNILNGRPLRASSSDWQLEFGELHQAVKKLLPVAILVGGVKHSLRKVSPNDLQFILCMAMHVLFFVATGTRGKRARRASSTVYNELAPENEACEDEV